MADAQLRQRKPVKADDKPQSKTRSSADVDAEEAYSPWVDVLRVLTFLILASCGLSYAVTSGKSLVWGGFQPPDYLKPSWWKLQLQGPLYLTPEELSAYDGQDPEKPIYLAINGTIYDVSNGRHIYGPGGSYNVFAGVDASRAYVTGCFADDRTPDMRGVELMYLPLDDPETDSYWSHKEMAKLKERELEAAKAKVEKGLKHWVDFFAKSKKYSKVGYVKREEGWLEKQAPRELCAQAKKGRAKRKLPKNGT
jgi:predicted heme/steroid binding protein